MKKRKKATNTKKWEIYLTADISYPASTTIVVEAPEDWDQSKVRAAVEADVDINDLCFEAVSGEEGYTQFDEIGYVYEADDDAEPDISLVPDISANEQ